MYQNILIATDGSELAQRGVSHGLALAKAVGAKVTAVVVEVNFYALGYTENAPESMADVVLRLTKDEKEHARRILAGVTADAEKCGIPCEVVQVENARPHDGILKVAKEKGCDLIVMGSHGRSGFTDVLLGSVTHRVATHTKLPVLICH